MASSTNWLQSLETGGLTLLESLVGIIAPLAATKNPAYAPVISAASSAVQSELSSIASGNAPTLHDPALAQLTAATVAGVATAVAKNNPNQTQLVQAAGTAIVNAALSALQPTPAPAATTTP